MSVPHASNAQRIAYVCKRYPRFSETFVVNEILAHQAAGLELEIFALRPVEETHFQDQLARVRAPVTRFPTKLRMASAFWELTQRTQQTFPNALSAIAAMPETDGDDVAQAMMVALACHERGVGHLHAHFGTVATTVARLAARIAGIGFTFTAHAKDIYHDYDEPVRLAEKMRDAAAVVTVSDYNLDYLRQRYGHDAARAIRIYNGIELDRFAYAEAPPADAEILAVGRLVEKKGFHILLEALFQLRERGLDLHCRIIGQGPEESALRAQIAASGLEDCVTLVGPRPQSEVIEAMRHAAMLVCPCVVGHCGNRDGLPTVLLEAMALGTPCVATDLAGIPELVRDGVTGLCVPEGDPGRLAGAIACLHGDHALRRRLTRQARQLIEAEFDVNRSAARLRELFERTMRVSATMDQAA